MNIESIIKLAFFFCSLASGEEENIDSIESETNPKENKKINVLYIVHPNSILEQETSSSYIEPWIDKWESAINSFNGLVIVSKLDRDGSIIEREKERRIKDIEHGRRIGHNISLDEISRIQKEIEERHQRKEESFSKEHKKSLQSIRNFISRIDGNSKVFSFREDGDGKVLLGNIAMREKLDDLFLTESLGTITLGGCFDCTFMHNMCVQATFNNLNNNYPGHVKVDPSLTVLAGPVYSNDKGGWDNPNLPNGKSKDESLITSQLRNHVPFYKMTPQELNDFREKLKKLY